MRKYIYLVLVLMVVSFSIFVNYLRDIKADIRQIRKITVTYLGQTQTISEGLNNLAGEEGSIQWSNSKVCNSANQHLSEVEAIVSGIDKNGQNHTAQYHFYINRDTGSKALDYSVLDGNIVPLNKSFKQIVWGTFS